MSGVGRLYDQRGNRKYLNASERQRFYEAACGLSDPGEKSFALTLFFAGCRISEALELTPAGVDAAERVVVLRTLKQREKSRYRAIPIPDDLLALLQTGAAARAGSERLWTFGRSTGWKVIKRCMAKANITGIKATPKGLRHAYAIASISAGVPLPTLQRWLGHANLNTTGIYLDFVGPDERELAAKIWNQPPSSRAPGSLEKGEFGTD